MFQQWINPKNTQVPASIWRATFNRVTYVSLPSLGIALHRWIQPYTVNTCNFWKGVINTFLPNSLKLEKILLTFTEINNGDPENSFTEKQNKALWFIFLCWITVKHSITFQWKYLTDLKSSQMMMKKWNITTSMSTDCQLVRTITWWTKWSVTCVAVQCDGERRGRGGRGEEGEEQTILYQLIVNLTFLPLPHYLCNCHHETW